MREQPELHLVLSLELLVLKALAFWRPWGLSGPLPIPVARFIQLDKMVVEGDRAQ